MRNMFCKAVCGLSMVLIFIVIGFIIGFNIGKSQGHDKGYIEGRIYENARINKCYDSPKFSGFVWQDDSAFFTCESDMKKGKIVYNKTGEK